MLRLKKISRIIIPVLLAIILCYATNATLNQHYHKLSSGLILNHSHPYNKGDIGNPFQEHHHTASQFVFLEQISNPVFLIGILLLVITCFLLSTDKTNLPLVITLKNPDLYFLRNYHAPPDNSF